MGCDYHDWLRPIIIYCMTIMYHLWLHSAPNENGILDRQPTVSVTNTLPKSRPRETHLQESLDLHERHTYTESLPHVHQPWEFRDGGRERRTRTEFQSQQDSKIITAPDSHSLKLENDSKLPPLRAVSPENNVPRAQYWIQSSLWFCRRLELNFRGG